VVLGGLRSELIRAIAAVFVENRLPRAQRKSSPRPVVTAVPFHGWRLVDTLSGARGQARFRTDINR
jgi:hypothetical protein